MTVDTATYVQHQTSHQEISNSNSITTLAQGSMFWRPVFLADSKWLEHVPLAFWLIEAHKPSTVVELGTQSGVSYFAMCQAVDRLRLETNCYAVGTWQSESSENQADISSLYKKVKSHNDAHYPSFSRLVTTNNQKALEYFSDNSIDLIHFNDLQGYESGRQLISSWLPKLSDRGLILINETNVRDENHYVHRLFEELKETNPTFEFRHGQGLGLLGVGENQQELVEALFEDAQNRTNTQVVRDVFSRLGRACADSYSANISEIKAAALLQEAEKLKLELESLEESLSVTQQCLDKNNAEMDQLQQRIHQQVETQALERGQLVERTSLIQKLYEELKSDTTRLQNTIEESSTQLRQQDKELFQLTAEKTFKENELEKLRREIAELRQVTAESNQKNVLLKKELADELSQSEINKSNFSTELDAAKTETKSTQQQLEILSRQYESDKSDLLAELVTVKEKANNTNQRLEELSRQHETDKNTLLTKLANVEEETKIAQRELGNRSRQLKALTATMESQVKNAEVKTGALQEENEQLKSALADRFREIAALTNLIESTKTKKNPKTKSDLANKNNRQTTQVKSPNKGLRHTAMAYLESRKHIKLIRQSDLFDPKWYIEAYPDLASSKKATANPIWHYVNFGGFEGRNPSDKFSSTWYLAQNPDVAREGTNPLVHYILNGESEGRLPKRPSDQL